MKSATQKYATYQQRRSFDTEFDGATLALGAVVESGVVDVVNGGGIGHWVFFFLLLRVSPFVHEEGSYWHVFGL